MRALFSPSAIARLLATAMLILALGRHHYGFYQLLRLVVCGASAYSAFVAANSSKRGWAWLLGLIAVLFNPFLPVYLRRSDWTLIDPIVAGVLVVSLGFVREATDSPN